MAADLSEFQLDDEPLDAFIGRLVLMYCPDLAAVLRRPLAFVKPAGIVAFQKLDLLPTPPPEIMSHPLCEACVTTEEVQVDTLAERVLYPGPVDDAGHVVFEGVT